MRDGEIRNNDEWIPKQKPGTRQTQFPFRAEQKGTSPITTYRALGLSFLLVPRSGTQRPLTRGPIIPKTRVNVDDPWAKCHENNASATLV